MLDDWPAPSITCFKGKKNTLEVLLQTDFLPFAHLQTREEVFFLAFIGNSKYIYACMLLRKGQRKEKARICPDQKPSEDQGMDPKASYLTELQSSPDFLEMEEGRHGPSHPHQWEVWEFLSQPQFHSHCSQGERKWNDYLFYWSFVFRGVNSL